MAKFIKYKTDEGNEVWIEIEDEGEDDQFVTDDDDHGSDTVQASDDSLAEKVKLSKVLESIKPLVNAIYKQVEDVAVRPQEVAVEFGMKFNAQVGVVLAKATTGANMTIKLKWNLDK